MSKFKLIAAGVIVAASLSGGVALAQDASCTITGTGPGSNNVCQFDSNNSIIFTCINNILVVNGTDQTATTGITQADSNTHVGTVSSGDAINEGETTTNADATCLAAAPTPTPTPAPTPNPAPTPGRGSEGPAPAPRPPVVTGLPNTGSTVAEQAGIAAAATTALAVATAIALRVYRRHVANTLS